MRYLIISSLLLISCSDIYEYLLLDKGPGFKTCSSDSECGEDVCMQHGPEKICSSPIARARHAESLEGSCNHSSMSQSYVMRGYVTDYCTRLEVRKNCLRCGHVKTMSTTYQGVCPP